MIIWFAALVVAYLILYAVWMRKWLKTKKFAWSEWMFAQLETIEIWLWDKSETILVARLKIVVGILLTIMSYAEGFDPTPILPIMPDEWEPYLFALIKSAPMLLVILGALDEWLRRDTTRPLEVVSLPENKPLPPAVESAVETVNAARTEAIAVIRNAKATGAI